MAGERTELAWWRTGLAALAVAVGIGRLAPELQRSGSTWPYVVVGVGFALYGIALFTQGNEAWAEWRRTGNPSTVAMGPGAYPDVLQVPRRWPYASNEQTVNAQSWADAVAIQGPDTYATRVWWDK